MPLLYPLMQQTWNEHEHSNDEEHHANEIPEKGRRLSVEEGRHHVHRRRRRKNWDFSSSTFDAFDEGVFIKGDEETVGMSKNRIQRSQERRRLQQQRMNLPLQSEQYLHYHRRTDQFSTSTRLYLSNKDYEFINICRGYFGSYTPQAQVACWCDKDRTSDTASDDTNLGSNDYCKSRCEKSQVSSTQC